MRRGSFARRPNKGIDKTGHVDELGDVQVERIEAHDINRKEIDAGHLAIVNVHEQGALGPELGRLRG